MLSPAVVSMKETISATEVAWAWGACCTARVQMPCALEGFEHGLMWAW